MTKLAFIIALFPFMVYAQGKAVVLVGFGTNKPPYVFEKENSGLEVEIFRETLSASGYEMKTFFGPLERLKSMINSGELDAISNTTSDEKLKLFISSPYVYYHNYAYALKKRKLKINSISDLKNYSVASFQRARSLLGDEFTKMSNHNPLYRELADQKLRNLQLFNERVDVVIADRRIFEYFNSQIDKTMEHVQPVDMFNLFKPTNYQAGFRSEKVMKDFNDGLIKIKKNGVYKKLETKYSNYK